MTKATCQKMVTRMAKEVCVVFTSNNYSRRGKLTAYRVDAEGRAFPVATCPWWCDVAGKWEPYVAEPTQVDVVLGQSGGYFPMVDGEHLSTRCHDVSALSAIMGPVA